MDVNFVWLETTWKLREGGKVLPRKKYIYTPEKQTSSSLKNLLSPPPSLKGILLPNNDTKFFFTSQININVVMPKKAWNVNNMFNECHMFAWIISSLATYSNIGQIGGHLLTFYWCYVYKISGTWEPNKIVIRQEKSNLRTEMNSSCKRNERKRQGNSALNSSCN